MGAHTIGNAEIFNSGFHGPWVSGEATTFNNQYYANLRYSTVQYSTVQYSTVQQPVLRQSQVQYSAVQCSTVQYNNQYYANLRDPGLDWTLTQRACTDLSGVEASECAAGQTTEWQYTSGGSGFNLPADMALYQVRGPPSLHCMIIIII